MAKNNKSPCSSDSAACNPAESDAHSDADPDPNQRFPDNDWPRFLVIKSTDDKSIIKHNFFVISKAIQGIAGTVKNVTPQRNSDIIVVQVDQRQQAINLLDTSLLHDIPVQITAHRTMNTCKGVIRCNIIEDLTDKQILEHLKESSQRVNDVYRIISYREKKKCPTNTFVVTFNQEKIPEKMYVGSLRVDVQPFIPNPRKCSNCQKFRHTKKFCRAKEPTCSNCGQAGHENEDCKEPPFCVNCKGDHPSFSRACPVWKREKEIVQLKHSENISFPEAIKRIEKLYPSTSQKQSSYSSVVSSGSSVPTVTSVPTVKSTVECQTDLTWPEDLTSPVLTSRCVISNHKVVQVQTATEMDLDIVNFKRTREGSSSSENELPTLHPSKRGSFNKLNKDSAKQADTVSPPTSDDAPGEGKVGEGGFSPDRGRPRVSQGSDSPLPSPPPRSCRTDKPASGRNLSPIKHP